MISQIYGFKDTPSKLNKSVTFNNKVKVREYGGGIEAN